MRPWPEAVERIAAHLRLLGAEARLEELPQATASAAQAARVVGCEPEQIVKSLVFACGAEAVLVLVPGDRRADPRKLDAALQTAGARVASPDRVREATGFAPGGVAPFALARIERIVLERTLLAQETVWVGAGSDRHLAALAPAELARLTRARVEDVVG